MLLEDGELFFDLAILPSSFSASRFELGVFSRFKASCSTIKLASSRSFCIDGQGPAAQLHADQASGFIDQVDGFVGKLPIRDVAVGEKDGGMDGRFCDPDAVENFIALSQAPQNGDGVFEARLIDS